MTDDESRSDGSSFAVLDLTHTELDDRVVVVRLFSDSPAQVHQLRNNHQHPNTFLANTASNIYLTHEARLIDQSVSIT